MDRGAMLSNPYRNEDLSTVGYFVCRRLWMIIRGHVNRGSDTDRLGLCSEVVKIKVYRSAGSGPDMLP